MLSTAGDSELTMSTGTDSVTDTSPTSTGPLVAVSVAVVTTVVGQLLSHCVGTSELIDDDDFVVSESSAGISKSCLLISAPITAFLSTSQPHTAA